MTEINYGPKYRQTSKPAELVKDLRFGKYLKLPAHRFSGNILKKGDTFYEIQNNLSWKRVENPVIEETA